MRTRTSAPSKAHPKPDQPSNNTSNQLIPAERPSKTFILPSSASTDARFLTLPNPRTGAPTRYFFCPKLGVYEFTVVASAPQAPRSTLITAESKEEEDNAIPSKGWVSKTAELLVATPIDVIFFMIPLLSPPSSSSSNQAKGLFQPLDDIIDSQDEIPRHLRYVLYDETFRGVLQARVEAICDTVEAGDEKLFRLSETKLLAELLAKAERMVTQGLPSSLEERFVRQALVTPMMSVKREDVGATTATNAATPNGDEDEGEGEGEGAFQEKQESQSTSATATTSATTPSGISTPATELLPDEPAPADDAVPRLLRISTALSFMKESYLPQSISTKLDEMLAAPGSTLDLKPLQDRLKQVADLRAEALTSRSLSDFSRKRALDDEDAAESRAEKKRKKEEEEKKKKAGESRGIRDLKKVNTSGMKKMSAFFSKAAVKKS